MKQVWSYVTSTDCMKQVCSYVTGTVYETSVVLCYQH